MTFCFRAGFIKFKGFESEPYPGGTTAKAKAANGSGSYHVPTCAWYGTEEKPPKCSGFYHDQEQTPEHAAPGKEHAQGRAAPTDR